MSRMIPPAIHADVRSSGERRVFSMLNEAAGTERWICLHSLGLAHHTYKRRAEIDFLLITGKGVFVLEVKAGRVARQDGRWVFTDKYERRHVKAESPFDQASSAMFALERDVRAHFGSQSRLGNLVFGYGVLFPDIEFDAIGCEADRALIYDLRDQHRPITAYIDRMTQFNLSAQRAGKHAPTQEDAEQLVSFLRGDFDVIPPLRIEADYTSRELLNLTAEQYGVLDALATHPRCLIQGSAGTGKTVLAVECARREARQGRSVLLLCYNRLLAAHIERGLHQEAGCSGITVSSVYQFFEAAIRRSSCAAEFQKARASASTRDLYRVIYPEYAGYALLERPAEPSGSLVVDEAQDMMIPAILDVLDAAIAGGLEEGRWRFFLDANNQAAVFGAFDRSALAQLQRSGISAVLAVNCRNTRQIATETTMLTLPAASAPARINGPSVSYAWYGEVVSERQQLADQLDRLITAGARPGSITVLSPRSPAESCAGQLAAERARPLDMVSESNVHDVVSGRHPVPTYSSIQAFKGLENDMIVLADVEDLDSEWASSVIYVGMSRARLGLYVLLHQSLQETYRNRLKMQFQRPSESAQHGKGAGAA